MRAGRYADSYFEISLPEDPVTFDPHEGDVNFPIIRKTSVHVLLQHQSCFIKSKHESVCVCARACVATETVVVSGDDISKM